MSDADMVLHDLRPLAVPLVHTAHSSLFISTIKPTMMYNVVIHF